eukprot:COSAG01_NODE_3647_length_5829_cov_27.360558_6_plen_98_part_00
MAQLFQAATRCYSSGLTNPRAAGGPPLCWRARKRGQDGVQARSLGERLGGAEPGSSGEAALLRQCAALGWDEFSWDRAEETVWHPARMHVAWAAPGL